ncbi:hypothetical protein RND71_022526 [Anisodus tanguticus]|uniref:Uncharacterized protein n=1 Tax=Anisodus tanguticus TaxID=243964 RepID=A0AAE1RTU1_9SOLA|nr:hypothetical protein RND71_022526 [Anisodus tanguticus]
MNNSRSVQWKDSARCHPSPVTLDGGGTKVMGCWAVSDGWAWRASFWHALSKHRVGSRVPIERMGCWIPKVGRTA